MYERDALKINGFDPNSFEKQKKKILIYHLNAIDLLCIFEDNFQILQLKPMLLEFILENYRSFKEKQILSLLPDEGKHEFEDSLIKTGLNFNLLGALVVYGANASGKSNLIRGMQSLRNLVLTSATKSPDEKFSEYDSFQFHKDTETAPTHFGIEFLLNEVRYHYQCSILANVVINESLYFYPQGREAKLFVRKKQHFEFGDYLKGQKTVVAGLTSENQLFLSKAAINNIQQLVEVYQYFEQDFMPIPFLNVWRDSYYTDRIAKELMKKTTNKAFIQNFKNLLKSFDTGIVDFKIQKHKTPYAKQEFEILVNHHLFDSNGKKVGFKAHPIQEESAGTQKLFVLAGLVLRALMNGRIIIIDEFERSLHPHIATFIIQLFLDPQINTKGAQLIVATHDTNLLSDSNLRRDQILIVEKDNQGASNLFSLADITGVRSQTPYEKWYLSGRFGGVPGIEKLNFELNYQYEEAA